MVPVPTSGFRAKLLSGSEAWLEYGGDGPHSMSGALVLAATPHCTFDPTGPRCYSWLPSPAGRLQYRLLRPRVWGTHVGAVVTCTSCGRADAMSMVQSRIPPLDRSWGRGQRAGLGPRSSAPGRGWAPACSASRCEYTRPRPRPNGAWLR